MGLQISFGVDYEVPVSGAGGGCWAEDEGVAEGDMSQHGIDDLCGGGEPGLCAHADRDTAAHIGIEGGAIPEGEEFAQVACGVSGSEEEILGAAFVGERVLGGVERECDG